MAEEVTPQDRPILHIVGTTDVIEGAGVLVHRALPSSVATYDLVDPFLLLDDASVPPDNPGFPPHPHRGFEILTYLLNGTFAHTDDAGHQTVLRAGGLQRITAGRGIWHGESLSSGNNGAQTPARGLQLWVNLAQADKEIAPDYQLVQPEEIPTIDLPEAAIVRLLAGEGTAVRLRTPVLYLDVTVPPGRSFSWPIPAGWQGFIYILGGRGRFGSNAAQAGIQQLLVLGPGDRLSVHAEPNAVALRFVLAAGQPHREAVRWRGGFVD